MVAKMPAKSKQQQKFFGVVKAMQSGDIPKKGAAGKVATSMSNVDVDKYASTKHKGLLKKVKEMLEQELKEAKIKGADGKACWDGYRYAGTENGKDKCVKVNESLRLEIWEHSQPILWQEAEYKGRKVKLGQVSRISGDKKFQVYVKNPKTDNIKKVTFGDGTGLSIKTKDPARRKSFKARHKCDQKKDRTSAGYWSCRMWAGPDSVKNMLRKK